MEFKKEKFQTWRNKAEKRTRFFYEDKLFCKLTNKTTKHQKVKIASQDMVC